LPTPKDPTITNPSLQQATIVSNSDEFGTASQPDTIRTLTRPVWRTVLGLASESTSITGALRAPEPGLARGCLGSDSQEVCANVENLTDEELHQLLDACLKRRPDGPPIEEDKTIRAIREKDPDNIRVLRILEMMLDIGRMPNGRRLDDKKIVNL